MYGHHVLDRPPWVPHRFDSTTLDVHCIYITWSICAGILLVFVGMPSLALLRPKIEIEDVFKCNILPRTNNQEAHFGVYHASHINHIADYSLLDQVEC